MTHREDACRSTGARTVRGMRPLARGGLVAAAIATVFFGCGPRVNVPAFSPADIARVQQQNAAERVYRVGPGDTLLIRFPFHPEMDQEAVVRPDGHITVATVGAVAVGGRVPSEIEAELRRQTSTRLRNPEVLVNVLRHGEHPVYVGGEVGRPGTVVYRKGLTPLQAVIASGGFLPGARIDSVVLVRAGGSEGHVVRKLDLETVVNAGQEEPVDLAPNDVLFVPRTPIANANVWVRQHITELLPFLRMSSPPMPR